MKRFGRWCAVFGQLFARMVWNFLCFDFITMLSYGLLLYIHCFSKNEGNDDGL